jgi:hypothetical protein
MLAMPIVAHEKNADLCHGAGGKKQGSTALPDAPGSDPTVTATPPVDLFIGEATTVVACAAPPGTTVIVDGAATREKSMWLWV